MGKLLQKTNYLFLMCMVLSVILRPFVAGAFEPGSEDTEIVTIISADIDELNAADITDLLNRVPGVYASDTSVKIRGSYDVKVILDGRPLKDPLARHSSIKWDAVSLNNIEKIEIYKGAGAGSFGDGTSGGAICITSKKIKGASGKIKTAWGNLGTQQHSASYNVQAGKFGFGLSGDYFYSDNYRENQDKEKNRFGLKAAYNQNKDLSYELYVDYSQEDRGKAGYPSNPTPNSREVSESVNPGILVSYNELKSNTYFGRYRKRNVDPDKSLYTLVRGWSLGEELSYSFDIGAINDINARFSFEMDHVTGNSISAHQEESFGLSFAKSINFDPLPLVLDFGLRANVYSDFENVINPEVKLGYKLLDTKLQLSVTRTNNVPPILKRFYETSTTTANPDLGMEKATNYTFSVARGLTDKMEAGVSFFYNEITDRISYVRGSGGTGQYENFGEVTRKGVESNLTWKPWECLQIMPSYTYLVAKDEETGLWITASPKHRAQVDIQYKPIQGLALTLIPEYVSEQFTRSDNEESAKPYFLLEFRADYSFKSWKIFAKVENVTDKSYYYGDGLPAPPREWLIGASFDF